MSDDPRPRPADRRDNPFLGILMMVSAVGVLSGMSVAVKMIGPDFHPMQVTFIRNVVAALVILPFILRAGGTRILRTSRPWMHAARALGGVLGTAGFFYAFARLPLADVMVVSQAVPLFTAALAVMFLGEQVGWRRWSAIAVGFTGVVVAVDPTGTVNLATGAVLFGTLCWAGTILLLRSLGATESPYTIVFYYMLAGTAISAVFMPWVWVTPAAGTFKLFVIAGVLGALGQYLMTFALKLAEASVVSPFNYTGIIWGAAFDLVIWQLWPAWSTLAGAVIISAAGIYIFRREARRKGA